MAERPGWVWKIEQMRNCRYVGYYDLPDRAMEAGAFYVFYQDEVPEEFRGDDRYDNYFAIVLRFDYADLDASPKVYITGAKSIRRAKFNAVEYEPGKFLVSRYRHDYVTAGEYMLDGGLSYCRHNLGKPPTHYMVLENGREVFYAIDDFEAGRRDNGIVQEQTEQADAG